MATNAPLLGKAAHSKASIFYGADEYLEELSTHENTSSCTSTVGAGPFVLDTGQRAAKILLSEIYTIMLTNNVSGGMGFAQGGWRLGRGKTVLGCWGFVWA